MAWKVEYQDRATGKRVLSAAFGDPNLAASYARTVKAGKVVPCDVEAPAVAVTKAPDGAVVDAQRAEAMRAALSEREAEAGLEAFGGARLDGLSVSDALDLGREAQARVRAEQTDDDRPACSYCGRPVSNGLTAHWGCQKKL